MYTAEYLVRITGGVLKQLITAPSDRKAEQIANEWASENDVELVQLYDDSGKPLLGNTLAEWDRIIRRSARQ